MIFQSEQSLSAFAEHLGAFLKTQKLPLCLELVGDVGAGKTTFTRALAKGLGVKSPVTSPSFTISKRYYWSAGTISATDREATPVDKIPQKCLVHYDFYRLTDPGIMTEDLSESLSDPSTITVVEWADTVQGILPKDHPKIIFEVLKNGNRKLSFNKNVIWDGSCSEISPIPQTPAVQTTTFTKRVRGNVVDERRTECCGLDDCESRTRTNSELETSNQINELSTTSEHKPMQLYLDTSSFTAKIKLTNESGDSFEYEDNLGREMAEKLLETLKFHLEDHGATFHDLKKITFMSGPGSFTGLRIGAAVVNTLSHELQIPLYDHKGTKHPIILPDYGRPANISKPKK